MKRLKAKLHSERGASILLALLMLLVCMMVGASVLAAAVSNAGKARSNRTEQQKFLNLSSAIQLVADEIQRAEYTGKYQFYEWTIPEKRDDDGNITTPAKSCFSVKQVAGEYTCGDLTAQLPFGPKLDEIFGKQFKMADGIKDKPGYKSLSVTGVDQYDLRVTLEGLTDDAPKGYEVPKEATVRVKLDGNTHHILLTAWEGAEKNPPDMNKAIQAELVVKEGTAPVLAYNPGARTAGDPPADLTPVLEDAARAPMKWELHWIRKGKAAS